MVNPRKKIFLICGSLNQTKMMRAVGRILEEKHDTYYAPFYFDGPLELVRKAKVFDSIFERTVAGGNFRKMTIDYLHSEGVQICERGLDLRPDLVVTCTDVFVPHGMRKKTIVQVQEGATNPETWVSRWARRLGLPPWCAGGTTMTGESGLFDVFCVASEGYLDFFEKKGRGIPRNKMIVTGMPNFDNCVQYTKNDFPHQHFVLITTSDLRETKMPDDRMAFLNRCKKIAGSKLVIFKLHPNEDQERAQREIRQVFGTTPLIFNSGSAEEMVANCDVLITQYSTLAFVGLALGKETHSYFDIEQLKKLLPWQNGGRSARYIGAVCESILENKDWKSLNVFRPSSETSEMAPRSHGVVS